MLDIFPDLELSFGTVTATAIYQPEEGDNYHTPRVPAHWELDECTGIYNDNMEERTGQVFDLSDLTEKQEQELYDAIQAVGWAQRIEQHGIR